MTQESIKRKIDNIKEATDENINTFSNMTDEQILGDILHKYKFDLEWEKDMKYTPTQVALDIVDVFAKYKIPIYLRYYIYKHVDAVMMEQIVVSPNREELGRLN